MNAPKPITVDDIDRFDEIVDARSPAEYADDRVPGAINLPVLDDAQRAEVGTLYVQTGAFEARRLGGALVAENLARHILGALKDKPASWKPLCYCWRGGMRSGSMVTLFRMVGWNAQPLQGGYKAWRAHVIKTIETVSPTLTLRVVCGPTGSGKTRVLQALAARGEQVLDLEAAASHKGSVLGNVPGAPQPSQKQFETRLVQMLKGLDPSRPTYVESEGRMIGRVSMPTPLLMRVRESPCIALDATPADRLGFLLRDYHYVGDDREDLASRIGQLHGLQSNATLARWQGWAREGTFEPLVEEMLAMHYDPLYEKSQHGNFLQLKDGRHVAVAALDDAGIERVAGDIAALG